MQSFEQLPSGRQEKSHVPSKDNHTWDTDATVKEVQMWPESQQMNWSEIARCHNVPGRNGGQIVKTIVQENGVDVSRFSANPLQKRTRCSKHKFPGQEVSIPANPTPAAIQENIKGMITSGKLSLGELCVPYTLAHLKVVDGELITTSSIVYGSFLLLKSGRSFWTSTNSTYTFCQIVLLIPCLNLTSKHF